MLSEQEIERLRLYVVSKLKENSDKFDYLHEVDRSLSYEENLNLIDDKIVPILDGHDYSLKEMQQIKLDKQIALRTEKYNNWAFWRDINPYTIAVVGLRGSGKTAMSFKILDTFRHKKKVYVYQHNQPALIKALGFHNMFDIGELQRLNDCIVYIDEPQIHFPRYDKKANDALVKLISIARQTNNTLLFSTSDTTWINRQYESYIDVWVIKDIEFDLVKRGSIIKKIYSKFALKADEFRLNINEYIFYMRELPEHNKVLHTFMQPFYYDDYFSKSYAHANRSAKVNAKV